ncbi:maker342 [Drosophila busckii]|uniref:Maker342 n=2 Tax=Drosophila busckii TaxID=30019 RepID=A0A0M3QZJ4_DROBS|nr:maker342 [Drosophila busckii]
MGARLRSALMRAMPWLQLQPMKHELLPAPRMGMRRALFIPQAAAMRMRKQQQCKQPLHAVDKQVEVGDDDGSARGLLDVLAKARPCSSSSVVMSRSRKLSCRHNVGQAPHPMRIRDALASRRINNLQLTQKK